MIEFKEGVGITDDKDIKQVLFEFAQEFETFDEMIDALKNEALEAWTELEDSTHEHDDTDYDNMKQEA